MRPVTPPTNNLPDNVKPARFQAPPEVADQVNDIMGLVHSGPDGEPLGLEFMFELSKDEIKVLRHEPYLTITMMADHLHPFAIQTSFPVDKKYDQLIEHQHVCTANATHMQQKWWRCDNPTHNVNEDRIRQCDECWDYQLVESAQQIESGELDEPINDPALD
jgi:hypothetical protein